MLTKVSLDYDLASYIGLPKGKNKSGDHMDFKFSTSQDRDVSWEMQKMALKKM